MDDPKCLFLAVRKEAGMLRMETELKTLNTAALMDQMHHVNSEMTDYLEVNKTTNN